MVRVESETLNFRKFEKRTVSFSSLFRIEDYYFNYLLFKSSAVNLP